MTWSHDGEPYGALQNLNDRKYDQFHHLSDSIVVFCHGDTIPGGMVLELFNHHDSTLAHHLVSINALTVHEDTICGYRLGTAGGAGRAFFATEPDLSDTTWFEVPVAVPGFTEHTPGPIAFGNGKFLRMFPDYKKWLFVINPWTETWEKIVLPITGQSIPKKLIVRGDFVYLLSNSISHLVKNGIYKASLADLHQWWPILEFDTLDYKSPMTLEIMDNGALWYNSFSGSTYTSDDDGATWRKRDGFLNASNTKRFEFYFDSMYVENKVYNNELVRFGSNGFGGDWEAKNLLYSEQVPIVRLLGVAHGFAWAYWVPYIKRSADNGITWETMSNFIPNGAISNGS